MTDTLHHLGPIKLFSREWLLCILGTAVIVKFTATTVRRCQASWADISWPRPSTEFIMAVTETGSGNNCWTQWAGDTIPTAIPLNLRPCWTCPWHSRHCPTLADYRNSRWRPSKPEVVMAVILNSCSERRSASAVHRRVRYGRKCRGSRWNRVEGSIRSIFVSISGCGGRHLDFR